MVMGLGALACTLLAAIPTRAGDDKQLQNMKGTVSYQVPSAPAKPLAPNATIALSDKDYAITGDGSEAAVTLADSSRVLVGSTSKVQLAFFNQVQGNNAKFVLYNGKVRFIVQHPQGAVANYTFQTATSEVAVRGTEGDISASGDTTQVNVYEVCNPSQPVVVTTKNGQHFSVVPGQSFVAQLVNGVIQTRVQALTQQMIDQFSGDFGVPTSWDAAQGQVVGYVANQAGTAVNNATGGIGGGMVGDAVSQGLGGLFKKKSTPTPSPTPASDTCKHS